MTIGPTGPARPAALTAEAARLAGGYAARRQLPLTACPYDPASSDPAERLRASAWVRGYHHWRPPETDFDELVDVDE